MASSDSLVEFYTEVQDILQAIEIMSSTVREVGKIHSQILASPKAEENCKRSLEDHMAEIKRTASLVRQKLKDMEKSLADYDRDKRQTAEYRIKSTQHSMLEHRVVQVMTEYNRVQNEYRERCKARIVRQLEITGRTVSSNEEIEEMLEQDNPAVFIQGIVMDTQQMKQTCADITARHEDILKLERSIRELHDMFIDMATLIEQQGDKIDRIENHVANSLAYVEKGREETIKALVYNNKARKVSISIYYSKTKQSLTL